MTPTPRTFASQGLRLSYLDWGGTDAPLLVLLHGVRDHARSWDTVARALQSDWRVIAMDLRGHGDSQWSPDGAYLTSYHLLDVLNLFDTLGDGAAVLVGHSFGGAISARLAASFPERVDRLALVDGFGPSPKVFAGWEETGPVGRTRAWVEQTRAASARQAKPLASVEDAAARLRAGNASLSKASSLHLAEHGVVQREDGLRWKFDPLVSAFPPEQFAADRPKVWGDIVCPTLLCYGERSWNTDPAEDGRAALIRQHRVERVRDAGHWLHHDQPEAFVALLKTFLAG